MLYAAAELGIGLWTCNKYLDRTHTAIIFDGKLATKTSENILVFEAS